MVHRTPPIRAALALAGLALFAGACSDPLVSPRTAAHARATLSGAGTGLPQLISSRVKYSDHGARPATGRSGTATLAVQALQGKDGTTELQVSAGTVAQRAPAAPRLAKVQVKQFDGDGDLLRTLNYNHLPGGGSASWAYSGLGRGGTLRVQANVNEGSRAEVVTVSGAIRLRPDLRASLTAPEAALVGTPVNILATVTEGNGDVGARADCVLLVDGAEADRASGIWVDAGDAVSCAFAHTFQAAGIHPLQVAVLNVVPGDFDPENNTAGGAIRIDEPATGPSDFSYYAEAEDYVQHELSSSHGSTELPEQRLVISDEWSQERTDAFRSTMFNGWMYRNVSLPLTRVELRQESDGAVIHAATFTDVAGHEYPYLSGVDCTSRWNGGALFYLCTSGSPEYPLTSFQYLAFTSAVTYSGVVHTTYWYMDTDETYYFYDPDWSGGWTDGLPPFSLGDRVSFSLRVTDGAATYHAATTVVMEPPVTTAFTLYPPTGTFCDAGVYEGEYPQSWNRCWTQEGTRTIRRGWVAEYLE
jgi:hypothetical protein